MLVFLFTDIEGSTRLWEEHTSEMGKVIARHDAILLEQVGAYGGRITKHTGDGITAVFDGGQPLSCALQTQMRFTAEPWGEIGALPIRAGLHAGETEFHPSAGTPEGDYFGPPVNCTARIMSAAWGGQILLTPEVTQASPLPEQANLLDLGQHLLKNVSAPQQLYQLLHPQLPRQEFPAPRTLSGQSIRQAVDERGGQIGGLEPQAMGIALLSATLLPALLGELNPESGALEGNLGVLEGLGAVSLHGFVTKFAERLQVGRPLPASEIQTLLHDRLLAEWQGGGEKSATLRADASHLLQAVHGVEAAMIAATDEVKESLARGLAGLGSQFSEFHWMLAGVQDTLSEIRARQALQLALQREQLDLQRQQLVKTNLLLHRQRKGSLVAELTIEGEAKEPPPADVPCPYKGLAAFEAEDAEYFFGREELIAELAARLAGTRFLAVVGPSGSGKSSLVRAGLLPAVWAGALPDSEDWQTLVLTPGAHPLNELAVRLSVLSDDRPAVLLRDLEADYRVLELTVRHSLADLPDSVKLLLVVDQFEEIFILCHDDAERRRFIDALLYAVEAEKGRTVVVPTIRADFYGRCAEVPRLAAHMSDGVLVGPMSEEEVRQAIERPAALVGLLLEPGLAETVLNDVAGEPGALPLLSHALLETWERRRGRTLTLSGYAESGGVAGAIAQTADTIYGELNPEQQALARNIFLRLTELGEEGAQDTRRRVAMGELVSTAEEAPAVETLLRTLADARLVTLGEDTVEVAHEALIRQWPALRGWLEENREGLRIHRHLTEAAGEWQRLGRETGELYRGARLAAAGEWAQEYGGAMNPLEREFLAASRELAEEEEVEREAQRQRELEAARSLATEQEKRAEEQTQSARRLRQRALLLAGAMMIAVVLAVVAFLAFRQADQNAYSAQVASTQAVSERNVAETAQALESDQRATAEAEGWARATAQAEAEAAEHEALRQASVGLAAQAITELEGTSPERAVLLALEALENYPYTPQAESALARAVWSSRPYTTVYNPDLRTEDSAWSPDGQRFVLTCDQGARVWNADTGREMLAFPEAWPQSFDETLGMDKVDWSPRGDLLATSYTGNQGRLWDASAGKGLQPLTGHNDKVLCVSFSPDGSFVATGSADATARIWDTDTGTERMVLSGHSASVQDLAWSPDGVRLLTAGLDGTARIWDVSGLYQAAEEDAPGTLSEGRVLSNQAGALISAAWSPDGTAIGLGGQDGMVRVWDEENGEVLYALAGHTGEVRSVAWSPDGALIASASADGTVRVWESFLGTQLFVLYGLSADLWDVIWSPDGNRLLTGAGLNVHIWDVSDRPLQLVGHDDWAVPDAVWSPDGTRIATMDGFLGTAIVWDAGTGQELLRFSQESMPGGFLTWSPNGDRIASGYGDGTAWVWDAVTGEELVRLVGHSDIVWEAVWSPDGRRIATSSSDNTARVWDATTGEEVVVFSGHDHGQTDEFTYTDGPTWSPAGDRIITGGAENVARIWDATTGQELLNLSGHELAVAGTSWSPDGKKIATGSFDSTARVWDATAGEELFTMAGHTDIVWDVAYSPDGQRIASGDETGVVKVWDADTGMEVMSFKAPGAVIAVNWSPDGTQLSAGGFFNPPVMQQVWQSTEELVDYAKDCCVFRELSAAEREQFGLTSR